MHEFGNWRGYSGTASELGSLMWCSDPTDSSILIRPCLDKIVNSRRPHGEVAVPEASNKSANPVKNK